MSVGPFILELVIVLLLSVALLHHYGRIRKQHPIVTIATLTSWYFSFIIIFILPLDVSSAFYRQCLSRNSHPVTTAFTTTIVPVPPQNTTPNVTGDRRQRSVDDDESASTTCEEPWTHVPDITLQVMWRIVYWSSQLLTWIILPFMQSYSYSGEFSTGGKVKNAIIKNAVYYGTYLAIVVALLIYVAANPKLQLDFSQLKVICITASNTWGLFLLVLLLGYGLVEFPRSIWNSSNPFVSIAYTQFKLAKLSTEKQEAIENLEDLLEQVKNISNTVRYNHPLRKYVNTIISKCPDEFQDQVSQGMDDYEDYDDGSGSRSRNEPTEKMLTNLHAKIIRAMQTKQRTTVQWDINMRTALHLDNVIKNKKQTVRVWVEETIHESADKSWLSKIICQPTVRWYWECMFRGIVFKVISLCLVVLSLMVIWSECTFFNATPVLSLFAIFLNHAGANYNYFYIELASCCIISYMCVCAYYTVFRIKFFNYYYIAGHHQTNEISLMFVGIMLCRLTPPLCLNFLGLIHLDAHVASVVSDETFYTKIMGHLVVIPIISKGFNIYFPILMVVLCIATYFSLGHRCLSAIGFQQFISGNMSDEFTADLVEEGRQLVNREKRKQMREFKSTSRRGNGMSSDSDNNIKSRQWQGRAMRDLESTNNLGKKNDKFELLNDVEAIDYSAINNDGEVQNDGLSSSSSGSRWNRTNTSQWSNRTLANKRPPSNIFDDI